MNTLSVITPTGYRPEAFELCIQWMKRQTQKPDEWIIITDSKLNIPKEDPTGNSKIIETSGWKEGENTQCRNVSKGIAHATGDLIAIIEDDDYYHPTYLKAMCREFENDPTLDIVGEWPARYYHVAEKKFKHVKNVTYAALFQTVMRRDIALNFLQMLCDLNVTPLDQNLWKTIKKAKLRYKNRISKPNDGLAIGIKGMKGRSGIGLGHDTKNYLDWQLDPGYNKLDEWLGEDAKYYKR